MAPVLEFDRLAQAIKFLAALHDVSRRSPTSWRRISALSARTGIRGARLELVVCDIVTAGLVQQHLADAGLVILTSKGWAVVGKEISLEQMLRRQMLPGPT